jgi:hypothetical protein
LWKLRENKTTITTNQGHKSKKVAPGEVKGEKKRRTPEEKNEKE